MVTSVAMHPDAWMDGVQVNAQDLRLQAVSAHLTGASPSGTTGIAARPGVRYGTGNPLLVAAASGMNITVNAGVAFVQGTTSATAGMYTGCLDTTSTLTVTTSDPINPRIDNVIVQVVDNGNNTSTTTVNIQAGTPNVSPVAPTLPANSLLLATIAVGAGVSSITSGNLTDKRVYTASSGGIVPMANMSNGITGQAGQYGHDLSNGRLRVSDGNGNARQPKLALFAPQTASTVGAGIANSTSATTILSTTANCDGVSEIAIFASWQSQIEAGTPVVGHFVRWQLLVDGSLPSSFSEWDYVSPNTNGVNGQGGSFTTFVTPTNGSHTFSWVGICGQGSSSFWVNNPYLRVSPSLSE
ncbi:MAG: hypothetical protein YHS30scaffold324_62 [Catenulispora phage 69_17]|jgi:hypothetical protein|nr:MAG: hypothetical protein YHS30scaffold324_62 [Catenulispora phage 69_17]